MKPYNSPYPVTKRIVIVEDNVELRNAYQIILQSLSEFSVVNVYGDAESALKHLSSDAPDLILLDLNLPGINGVAAISKIKKINSRIRVLVVTVHDDSTHVFDALCAGAIGYLTKDADHLEILNAVTQVFNGGAPMSAKIANMIVRSFHINPQSPLTDRETQVLQQLAQGKTYEYIAQSLFVSRDTIKTHIRHIYEKLQVNNKSDAVIKARNQNYV